MFSHDGVLWSSGAGASAGAAAGAAAEVRAIRAARRPVGGTYACEWTANADVPRGSQRRVRVTVEWALLRLRASLSRRCLKPRALKALFLFTGVYRYADSTSIWENVSNSIWKPRFGVWAK